MAFAPDTLLIDHIPGETRVAALKDDRLIGLFIDRIDRPFAPQGLRAGDIVKGRVVNVVPSLQAAFVDVGDTQNGFLPVNATYQDDISRAAHEGQDVLVQVKQTASQKKGAVLSCKIDLNSQDCVLTPHRPGINVSRKFQDAEKRAAFKQAVDGLLPEDCGLIVRTSAETLAAVQIAAQAQALSERWQTITDQTAPAPVLLERQNSFLEEVWAQLDTTTLNDVHVEGLAAYQDVTTLYRDARLYDGTLPLFDAEGVSAQIDEALHTHVPVATGAHLVIEETEALVAVDINMAQQASGRNLEANHLSLNIDALKALKEQIALRNLSGQILIDFIALKDKANRSKLEQTAKAILNDQRTTFHGLTRLGLGEISRTRQGQPLSALCTDLRACYNGLLRQLSKGGLISTLRLGPALAQQWHNTPPTWLKEKIGYLPNAQEDRTLPAQGYSLETQK